MTPNKIKNLISFSFLFHLHSDCKLEDQSPNYIIEKYNKFIGFTPKEKNDLDYDVILRNEYFLNPMLRTWLNRWNVKKEKFDSIKSILYYLFIVNSRYIIKKDFIDNDIDPWTISDLIETFEKYIGSVHNINEDLYNHVHPLLKDFFDEFIKKNQRDYNLLLID